MFSLIYVWINDWANNREAGDLRRQHGHYDVIVMKCGSLWLSKSFGRYANIENDDDGDGDGDGDGDDDPCKNALTAPEPPLAPTHSFSNISTILVLKNT